MRMKSAFTNNNNNNTLAPETSGLHGPGSSSSSFDDSMSNAPDGQKRIKCVFVGDAAVGKTSLIVSYTTNGYPQEYVPTAFDNYSVQVLVDDQPVRLQLCDTAGQTEFDSLRALCYPNTDIFILCFSVISPRSFYNIEDRWLPEIRRSVPKVPCIVVGTQTDLRTNIKVMVDLSRHDESPVSEFEARKYANKIGALAYIECSALTQYNLKDVFDTALLSTMKVDGCKPSKVLMQEYRGRKSFRKLKDKIKRSNSTDNAKNPQLQVQHRNGSHPPIHPNSLNGNSVDAPKKCPKNYSTVSAPASGLYSTSAVVTPTDNNNDKNDKKSSMSVAHSSSKLKKGWRRLLCMA